MRNTMYVLFLLAVSPVFSQQTAVKLEPNDKEILMAVTVNDAKKVVRVNDIVIFENQKTGKKYIDTTDQAGTFSMLLPKGETYNIKLIALTDTIDYDPVSLPNEEGRITFRFGIQYDPPKVYTLRNIAFDTGKSTLKPESYAALNDLVEVMKFKTKLIVEIAGHTDNTGNPVINQRISQERAETVKAYIVKKGIAASRIVARGYGDTMPIADNASEEGRSKNRRTEVHIISE